MNVYILNLNVRIVIIIVFIVIVANLIISNNCIIVDHITLITSNYSESTIDTDIRIGCYTINAGTGFIFFQ